MLGLAGVRYRREYTEVKDNNITVLQYYTQQLDFVPHRERRPVCEGKGGIADLFWNYGIMTFGGGSGDLQ